MQSTFEQVALIISRQMRVSIEKIKPDTMFCEVNCHDDKAIYEIILELESVFNIDLSEAENHYSPHHLVGELAREIHERKQRRTLRDAQRATKSGIIRNSTQDEALRQFGHVESDHTGSDNPVLQLSDDHCVS